MKSGRLVIIVFCLMLAGMVAISCSKREEGDEGEKSRAESAQGDLNKGEEEILTYVSEEISFGIFFDEEGTKRTITLDDDQKEFIGYFIVKFPEEVPLKAVQWKLVLPEGLVILHDDYYSERTVTLGNMLHGISESFPCVNGPQLLLHTITFRVIKPLEDAVISIMPTDKDNFLGVATCEAGYPMTRASSFKAVVNPMD